MDARRNVELKARDPDPERTLAAALAAGAVDHGELVQRDTYFTAPIGRLKLREQTDASGRGHAELVAYVRADAAAARTSSYRLVAVDDPGALRAALAMTVGEEVVVAKRRRLLAHGPVRIHLDAVDGLGHWVELEAVAADGSDLNAEHAALAALRAALDIADERVVAEGYAQLLAAARPPWVHAAATVRARAGERAAIRAGIVLGSGLGDVVAGLADAVSVGYDELPGFPVGAVAGHAQRLTVGTLAGTPVAVLEGRAHLYEGVDPVALRVPIRTLRELGATTVVLTNAAGSLRPEHGPGSLLLVRDHLNLTGVDPLAGPNDDAVGPRFTSMHDAYDPELRATAHAAARSAGVELAEGVYAGLRGPSFETAAEIRALAALGADAVGMSTVAETIVARHGGLRVLAISAITNLAEGLGAEPVTHEQTLAGAAHAADDLGKLLTAVVGELA